MAIFNFFTEQALIKGINYSLEEILESLELAKESRSAVSLYYNYIAIDKPLE